MNSAYNRKLIDNAQRLRRKMTMEERHLWYDFLQGLPISFHRQKVFGTYIVDFYCASAKLVVELDGSQHYEQRGRELDHIRDEYLRSLGLTIKRYSNADMNERFSSVCEDIHQYLVMNK